VLGVERQHHFMRAMCKSIDKRNVTRFEGGALDETLVALLRGDDVSGRIGFKPAHTRRSLIPVHVSLNYPCLKNSCTRNPRRRRVWPAVPRH
jgi:hypothetical protein